MRAMIQRRYGSPDVLELAEIPKPIPGTGELLVKVYATSVNSWDWDMLTGTPRIYRLMFGLFRPKINILGADLSGVVESVGPGVKNFKPGDAVLGDLSSFGWGGFAEFVAAPEKAFVRKPEKISFEQAAAIPQAGTLALQALRQVRDVKPGDKILINGGGGGAGTFGIQLAVNAGAEVTAVDHGSKLMIMKEAGAHQVIDYTKADFTVTDQRYDRIIDMVADRSVFTYRKLLVNDGIFVMVGGRVGSIAGTGIAGSLLSVAGRKKSGLLFWKPDPDDFKKIAELVAEGKIRTFIEKSYPLERVPQALAHLGDGKALGKLIILPDQQKNVPAGSIVYSST